MRPPLYVMVPGIGSDAERHPHVPWSSGQSDSGALLQADFTSQLTTKVARVLDNLHEVWRHFVAPYARENPDPSEYKEGRWGVKEDDSEEGVKVRVSPCMPVAMHRSR